MLLLFLKASDDIEICFIMASSSFWVHCSVGISSSVGLSSPAVVTSFDWSDMHPDNNTSSTMTKNTLKFKTSLIKYQGFTINALPSTIPQQNFKLAPELQIIEFQMLPQTIDRIMYRK